MGLHMRTGALRGGLIVSIAALTCLGASLGARAQTSGAPAIVLPAQPDVMIDLGAIAAPAKPADAPPPAAVAPKAPAAAQAPVAPPPPLAQSNIVPASDVQTALAERAARARAEPVVRGTGVALAKQRGAVADFYAARGYQPLWTDGGAWTPAAQSALARLALASEDGLDLRATPPPPTAGDTTADLATADFSLSLAVANYAWQASGGRVDPKTIDRLIDERPSIADTAAILTYVPASLDAGETLRSANPPQPGYAALRDALAALRRGDILPEAGKSATDLENEVLANMERWRWAARTQTTDQIEVNIPDFTVKVTLGGVVVHRARVVVGKPDTPTPVFSNSMQFLEVNPYWNVPQSIIQKEMMPKLAKDPDYLRRLGYEVATSSNGKLTVRQPPGERNALGRIKFMFPNDHAVYLHDTPQRGYFNAAKRDYSHGCVRVDDPFKFAEIVLGSGSGWSEARIKKLIGGKNQTIQLPRHIDIHIEYFTAFIDEGGALRAREDIYGISRKVRAALGLASEVVRAPSRRTTL